jgi:hypothetical protein
MARKDRVPNPPKRPQGPQRRSSPTDPAAAARQRRILALVAGSGLIAVAIVLAIVLLGGGGGEGGERAALEKAGCTLVVKPGVRGEHSVQIGATSPNWNTDPPTTGPHNELPAVWGSYEEPVPFAQTLHNLEHGGVAIHYGDDVPASDVDAIQAFYDDDPNGLIVARLPKLGKRVTLSAWTTEDGAAVEAAGQGFLASCPRFDEEAFSSFLEEHRFKGPERLPPDALVPGT